MYCILVTGIPAAGKSVMAEALAGQFRLPVLSKDCIKELMFDRIGFQSREEKVALGTAAMDIMYYAAEQLMRAGKPFILENNFEHSSERGIRDLLEKYQYPALTLTLTGDYKTIYQRFLERESAPGRHRGHIVNDCYPERGNHGPAKSGTASLSYESYLSGIKKRGFDDFSVGGKRISIDTTDFAGLDMEKIFLQITLWIRNLQADENPDT